MADSKQSVFDFEIVTGNKRIPDLNQIPIKMLSIQPLYHGSTSHSTVWVKLYSESTDVSDEDEGQ